VDVLRDLPKVSVIVPVYNAEKYLGKCFHSLYQQTLRPEYFEIIVVDDRSTDNSLEICSKFSDKRENVKILKNTKNLGLGLTRNRGIKESKGEYIYFLDADDYIDPITLEKLLMIAYSEHSDMVVSGYYQVKSSGSIITKNKPFPKDIKLKSEILKSILSFKLLPIMGGRFVRKSLFVDYNIKFEEGYHEDVLINFFLFFYANNIVLYDDQFYYWVRHKETISRHISKQHIDGLVNGLLEGYNFLLENTDKGFFRQMLNPIYEGFLRSIKQLIVAIYKFEKQNFPKRKMLYQYLFLKIKNEDVINNIFLLNQYKEKLGYKFFNTFNNNISLHSASLMTDELVKIYLNSLRRKQEL
jgi:glycosyltransferase involved in cell wall biosynthesis